MASSSEPSGARLSGDGVAGHVVRGGTISIVAAVVTNLLVALGAIILLRYLGVADVGRYGTVMAVVAIVQGITDAGLGITAIRELALVGEQRARRELLADVLGLRIVLTSAGVLGAVAFTAVVGYDGELVAGTALAGAAVLLFSVQAAMTVPLSVDLRNGRLALSGVLRQALLVAAWGGLVLAGAGLLGFFAVQILAAAILLAVTPLLVGRADLVRPRWSGPQLRRLAAVGLSVALASLVAAVYYRVLTIMASLLTGEDQTGLFVTAARVFELVGTIPVLLVGVVLPVMTVAARDDRVRLARIARRMTEAMAVAGIGTALAVAGAAEPIVVVLGGEEFRPAAPVVRIMAVALASLFVGAAWSPVLLAAGRQRWLAVVSSIGLAVVVALGLVLIPARGAEGAAIAFAIADWALLAALFVAVRRAGVAVGVGRRFGGGLAAVTAVAAAVTFAPWASPLVRTVAGLAAFVAGVLALGLAPRELLVVVRRRSDRRAV